MRVLLVEDRPAAGVLLKTLLAADGALNPELRHVRTLDDTLSELSRWAPDAVLLTLDLPDSEGLLTLERAVGAAGAAPVLVVADVADPERRERCLRLGAADFILRTRVSPEGLERALHNATRRAELQGHLTRTRQSFQAIVERSADGLVVSTGRGELLYANPSALIYEGLQAVALHVMQTPGQGDVELDLKTWQGSHRDVLVSRSVTRWNDGPAALLSLRDVTLHRAAEARARRREEESRRAQRLDGLGQLAGGIAHEFNNLLMVIRGHAELIEDSSEDAIIQRHAMRIAGAADRSTEIARQLMMFASRDRSTPETVDCAATVHAMESPLRKLLGEDVALVAHLPGQPALAHLVPGQLEQVLVNLVSNARDAIDGSGQVTLSLARVPRDGQDGLRLTVADDGCGMDAETVERAPEPFFTTKDVGAGTGLGLSAVYGVVSGAGGTLAVDSEPGQGTRVRVWLPSVAGAPADVRSAAPDERERRPAVVLVAEDEAELRRLVVTVLEQAGHEVLSAEHPAAALALPEADLDRVEVLVSDFAMPGASGLALHAQLSRRLPGLPFVLMSGYARGAEAARTDLPAGAIFLQKPFSLRALQQTVQRQLDRSREQR